MNAEEVQVWSSQDVEMACSFGHLRRLWLHMTPPGTAQTSPTTTNG
jgi:hypothetical protein